MKLTKCVNGHFYDEEKFEGCPHCAGGSKLDVNAIFGGAPSAPKPAMSKVERDDDLTVPLEWTPAETPAAETSPVKPVSPAAETVSPVAAEIPATETVSPVAAEIPATESVSPVAADISATESVSSMASAGSSVDSLEETVEEMSGNVEPVVDIQSQPSFDTPLDFDAGFTEGENTVDEDGPTEEPEEEFELLSKFDSGQADAQESEVTIEPEPFVAPEPTAPAEPEPFVTPEPTAPAEPEPTASAEPEPFAVPEPTAPAEPEPFAVPEPTASAEPEPFVAPEPTASAEPKPFVAPEPTASAEPEPFVAPEPVQAAWEMPQPNVEEIPTGNSFGTSTAVDPELEDQPTEIVDIEEELVNGIKETPEPGPFVTPEPTAPISETVPAAETPVSSVPSPAAAMFGASVDDDDDEHTVAFYDEIFVSKAPVAPVVPMESPVVDSSAAPAVSISETAPVASAASVSESAPVAPAASVPETAPTASAVSLSTPAAEPSGDAAGVPEPDVFTAPPLQPAQALPTPCVGWLIALNGSHIGQDFHLRVGKNYIGRDVGMDIALTGDKSVSRNKHAIVIYEPKHHKYFIQPGESNELVYVNDEVVLLPMPLKAYDVIVIGDIELWFMPLCDDQHNWSEVIRKLQEQM